MMANRNLQRHTYLDSQTPPRDIGAAATRRTAAGTYGHKFVGG